jgi:cytochrome c5
VLVLLLTPSAPAASPTGDSAGGKRLHDANCVGCHDTGIGAPIRSPNHDWNAALALRDAARRAILARVFEPDADTRPAPAGAFASSAR